LAPSTAIETTPIHGLTLLRREPVEDNRGSLDRVFDVDLATSLVPGFSVAQINHTVTVGRGTVRGLHYQIPPLADAKILTCLRGRIFDVVADLRRGSPTFLTWHGVELAGMDGVSVVVPTGLAHGYQLLDDSCELLYVHGERYHQRSEGGVHPEDPMLGVRWPEEISRMSDRDRNHSMLDPGWTGIEF